MSDIKYKRLGSPYFDSEDNRDLSSTWQQQSSLRRILHSLWLKLAVSFVAGVLVTLAAIEARQSIAQPHGIDMLQTAGSVKTDFIYNDTFPGPPTPESEQEWLNLLPNGLGFLQHEDLDPGIVDISVFHQLHCLMALRHSIYDAWNGTRHSHMTPHHTKHCLEYIRQSIMCNVDTNIERRQTFEDGSKFTPGWEIKQCRDYDQVKAFAEKWRVWDGKTPSTKKPVTDPEVIRGRVIFY